MGKALNLGPLIRVATSIARGVEPAEVAGQVNKIIERKGGDPRAFWLQVYTLAETQLDAPKSAKACECRAPARSCLCLTCGNRLAASVH